jgi:hypothetical protein
MFILLNWHIIRPAGATGSAVTRVGGQVFGHPRFRSGDFISTSGIASYRVEAEAVVVTTSSGSEYVLGKPLASEPFARRRLIRYLDQQAALQARPDADAVTQQLPHPDATDTGSRRYAAHGESVDTVAQSDVEVVRG